MPLWPISNIARHASEGGVSPFGPLLGPSWGVLTHSCMVLSHGCNPRLQDCTISDPANLIQHHPFRSIPSGIHGFGDGRSMDPRIHGSTISKTMNSGWNGWDWISLEGSQTPQSSIPSMDDRCLEWSIPSEGSQKGSKWGIPLLMRHA